MSRILIITTVNTGSGHKSIADALHEQFNLMPDVEVKIIDGFDLAGKHAYRFSDLYGTLTRHAPWLYNISWKITDMFCPHFIVTAQVCRRRFYECIDTFKPDLIITVHSLFNTLITRLLKKHALHIPVVVMQADLVSIHSTWCNPDAYRTICPTKEAYEVSLKHKMPEEKLKIIGFPVRSRFVKAARESVRKEYDPKDPLKVLLMSGGEGSSELKDYAKMILTEPNVKLTIICGRNKKLHDSLETSLKSEYKDRARILGFVDDIEHEMLRNDLLITRGSPNTLTEAVTLGLPVIMTGPFLEQERGNFTLAKDHSLGAVSLSKRDVVSVIRDLLKDDAAGLKKIRAAQEEYRCFDSAHDIAAFALELIKDKVQINYLQRD